MKKSIITIIAFMLFALAGFAQSGERVYIRIYNSYGSTDVHVLENGTVTKSSIPQLMGKDKEGNLKELGKIFEAYYAKGFEIKATTNLTTGSNAESWIEYILQKD